MNRRHALLIALMLGLAALVGAFALARTTHLGAATRAKVSATQIARQESALRRAEAALRRQITRASATPAAPAPRAQRVMYVRPKPVIVTIHRHGGEHEQEGQGGGFDD
jgi:hypothetical protein